MSSLIGSSESRLLRFLVVWVVVGVILSSVVGLVIGGVSHPVLVYGLVWVFGGMGALPSLLVGKKGSDENVLDPF